MANRVISTQGEGRIQRKCVECREEEGLRTKPKPGAETTGRMLNLTSGGGRPLADKTAQQMGQAFDFAFDDVRVHTGHQAAKMNEQIGARAFTHGSDIYFNQGEYQPQTQNGRHLLAHELTHVVQQSDRGQTPPIQRRVSPTSNCPANADGAGATPLEDLRSADQTAMIMCLGAALGLAAASNVGLNSLLGGRPNSPAFSAYERRFGRPELLASGRFRNRFNGRTFADEEDAINGELSILSSRLARLADFFGRNVRYRCVGTGNFVLGGCAASSCDATQFAATCPGRRSIAICPFYWTGLSEFERAIGLIHEASHAIFHFGDPSGASMTIRRRGVNPVCYSGLVAEIEGGSPPDPDCPPIITLAPIVIGPGGGGAGVP